MSDACLEIEILQLVIKVKHIQSLNNPLEARLSFPYQVSNLTATKCTVKQVLLEVEVEDLTRQAPLISYSPMKKA